MQPEKIRLGCIHCDRIDFDGVEVLPNDWFDVQAVLATLSLDWETHLGVCPDCSKHELDLGGRTLARPE